MRNATRLRSKPLEKNRSQRTTNEVEAPIVTATNDIEVNAPRVTTSNVIEVNAPRVTATNVIEVDAPRVSAINDIEAPRENCHQKYEEAASNIVSGLFHGFRARCAHGGYQQ